MQKIATRVFVYSSIAFGAFGVLAILTSSTEENQPDTDLFHAMMKLMFISGFIVLSSFAISVAGKYLNGK